MNLGSIERELRTLWEAAGPNVTRASLFNLIAVAGTGAERDRLTDVVGKITVRHPCRAIVLLAQPEAPTAELSATVDARCHLAGGGRKQVCCEQIVITASRDRVGQAGSAVLPLLESDLPVVLWWSDNFLAQPALFTRLSGVADKVICDSSALAANWPALSALARTHTLADLNWARLNLWRKLLSDCFDDPLAGDMLGQMAHLEVVYGCGPGAAARAQLFAAWLGTQLGWSPTDTGRMMLCCREDNDALALGVIRVQLRGSSGRVTLQKNFGEWTATAQVETPSLCGLPRKQAFAPLSEPALLAAELDQVGRHPVYERALSWLAAGLTGRGSAG